MKKKVALYICGIGTGGIESCSISQFSFMDRERINVKFLVDAPPVYNFNVQKIKACNGEIVSCFNDNNGSKLRKLFRPFAFVNTIKKEKFDVVHLHISNPTALLYAFLCKVFTKAKVVATSHAQGVANRSNLFVFLCLFSAKHLSRFCDYRLADSSLAGKWMFANRDFEVMVNGIDVQSLQFNPQNRETIRTQLKLNTTDVVVGHVGRFATDKNHQFIILVFNELLKTKANVRLLLIGKGELRENIISKCDELNIRDKVVFVESAPDLAPYYSAMDLFLFPSLREGFGLVAVEAQAASLPVLASSAVPKETTQTDIIDYANLSDKLYVWVEKIKRLLLTREQRKAVDISNLKLKCDIHNISEQLVKIYQNL